jgi:hypothetical protein
VDHLNIRNRMIALRRERWRCNAAIQSKWADILLVWNGGWGVAEVWEAT